MESLSHASVHQIGGHRRRASEDAGAKFPVEQMLPLIITIMGICLNCRVRTKEITIEVILFEYSRTSSGRPPALLGVTPDRGVLHIRHPGPANNARGPDTGNPGGPSRRTWKLSQIDTSTAIGQLATVAILAQGTISG